MTMLFSETGHSILHLWNCRTRTTKVTTITPLTLEFSYCIHDYWAVTSCPAAEAIIAPSLNHSKKPTCPRMNLQYLVNNRATAAADSNDDKKQLQWLVMCMS